ncbi:MAG TPA: ABC transporter permease [Pyrinomonadaceae bacterium]|nr:ABC transporter permease [Pyrinomonadaceae bacterium]
MLQDLRLSLRMFKKSPVFTLIVVLTLALGIGVNVAIFSVVNSVLLNPLPFTHPEQLVSISQSKPNFERGALTYPNFVDLQRENQTFSAMAIHRRTTLGLIGAGESESLDARSVSADYFKVLDVKPQLGRTFVEGEDLEGAQPVVVISGQLWERKFGSAPDIIGKMVNLDDKMYQIIGVLPKDFTFGNFDVYQPIGQLGIRSLKSRSAGLGLRGIGRLKPGVSIDQASVDLNRLMQNLANTYPATNRAQGAKLDSLKGLIVGDIGTILWMLLGAVGFVLLIACVNVGNLLLARSMGRTREYAIRAALGAGKWRLLRQSLVDSMLFAITGGTLGLLFAAWGTKAALAVFPSSVPRSAEVGVDSRVLIFATVTSVFAGIVSGVAPALKLSGWSLSETLKEGERRTGSTRGRAQGVMVAVEVGLAVVLLIGAGLMIRSLSALWNVDPGYRTGDNLLTFNFSLPPEMKARGDGDETREVVRDLRSQIKAVPGVRYVSFSGGAFPLVAENDITFFIPDHETKPESQSEMHWALTYRIEPDYFTAMGIPLKRGRYFTEQDDERAEHVAIIDEVLAHKYFGDTDPLGKHIQQGDKKPQTIVGVVGHVKQWSIDADETNELQAQLYEPFVQLDNRSYDLTVLIGVDEGQPIPFDAIRNVIYKHSTQNVIAKPRTMKEVIGNQLKNFQFSTTLFDIFAVVALLLASIGLYGVISYLVGQRTQEFGIRLALGAQRSDIMRLVLGHGMKLALIGVALGLFAAYGLTRFLQKLLFGVTATDPLTFAVISLVVVFVAVLACIVPARRAMKVDPLQALRYE